MNLLATHAQQHGQRSEAAHQDALLNALYQRSDTLLGAVAPYELGLSAYRNNGSLNAARALSLMFPAAHALLGEDDFYPLARLYWLAQPPQRGDWSQYGADFGDWIAAHNPGDVLDALPFLPDLAKLDDAHNRCQDACDMAADLSTLALLEGDPATLRIVLHPSVRVLDLNHGVLTYRLALLAAEKDAAQNTVVLPNTAPCYVAVARQSWRALGTLINATDAAFVRQCLAGATVFNAHNAALEIDPLFDAAQWLTAAIAAQWLLRVEAIA